MGMSAPRCHLEVVVFVFVSPFLITEILSGMPSANAVPIPSSTLHNSSLAIIDEYRLLGRTAITSPKLCLFHFFLSLCPQSRQEPLDFPRRFGRYNLTLAGQKLHSQHCLTSLHKPIRERWLMFSRLQADVDFIE